MDWTFDSLNYTYFSVYICKQNINQPNVFLIVDKIHHKKQTGILVKANWYIKITVGRY